jgi:hypothetical protein
MQRARHANNKLRQDRKMILNEIGFAWKDDGAHTLDQNDKLWHQHHAKLVEHKRINGHCKVPRNYKEDKFLGIWIANQRQKHANHKMRLDRKKLLDELDFFRKADTVATRSSTTDVRGLAI